MGLVQGMCCCCRSAPFGPFGGDAAACMVLFSLWGFVLEFHLKAGVYACTARCCELFRLYVVIALG